MLNNSANTLIRLLRIAIGAEQVESFGSEGVAWQSVYALARKQGVLAVAFDGLMKIFEQDKKIGRAHV